MYKASLDEHEAAHLLAELRSFTPEDELVGDVNLNGGIIIDHTPFEEAAARRDGKLSFREFEAIAAEHGITGVMFVELHRALRERGMII